MCDCFGGSKWLITDWASGDVVCRGCGVVVEGHILDEAPEWTHREGAPDKSRVGMPSAELGTVLDTKRRKLHDASQTSRDRALREGLELVDSFVTQFRLSTTSAIAVTARDLYRDFDAARGVRNDNRRCVAGASLYFACKIENMGRELRLVANVCGLDRKQFHATTADFKECLEGKPYHELMFQTLHPSKLVDIFLDRLHLPSEDRKRVWKTAMDLCDILGAQGLVDSGRKPRTLCGGVVWVALRVQSVDVSKKDVSEACDVCQQTLDKAAALVMSSVKKADKKDLFICHEKHLAIASHVTTGPGRTKTDARSVEGHRVQSVSPHDPRQGPGSRGAP